MGEAVFETLNKSENGLCIFSFFMLVCYIQVLNCCSVSVFTIWVWILVVNCMSTGNKIVKH